MPDATVTVNDQAVEVVENGDQVTIEVTEQSVEILEHPSTIQGPIGPVGPSGEGDLNYTHNQTSPSTEWTINHNLGKFPSVSIADSSGNLWQTEVDYIDQNSLVVRFSAAFSGKAYLN